MCFIFKNLKMLMNESDFLITTWRRALFRVSTNAPIPFLERGRAFRDVIDNGLFNCFSSDGHFSCL